MTLSNFDWTDKTSVKWFIMLPTGHEGPYSLDALLRRKTSPEMKIWAEGLPLAVPLKVAVQNSQKLLIEVQESVTEEDEIPPLPDLSEQEESVPPVPVETYDEKVVADIPILEQGLKKKLGLIIGVLLILGFGLKEWVKSQEHFSIHRPTGMNPELFQKITSDFKFEAWNKKIFFKEYVPADMSHIWMVTSSFQTCQVEAQFSSVNGKLLAVKDEKIVFKTSAKLSNHITEFSKFDFISGNKIVPGLYEMDLKATACSWDGMGAKLGNWFKAPDPEYITRMKIVLYHKGNVEFNSILDKLIRKKMAFEIKNQNQEELFWLDVQQKLQTLLAISLQIEQVLLEFVEKSPEGFSLNLKQTVDKYTRDFGRFLTEFVVANEKYFQEMEKSEIAHINKKRDYEKIIRLTSKNIGLESMKIIEQLQSWKKPTKKDLGRMETKIKKQFEVLKEGLNQRIIQLTEDRTK